MASFKDQLRYLPLRLFIDPLAYTWTSFLGVVSHWSFRPFKNLFIRGFNWLYRVDLTEAFSPNLTDYPHFNAWFTRKLKPELRPIDESFQGICSPVDGRVIQMGDLQADQLLPVKGQNLSLEELFAGKKEEFSHFVGGKYAILYLSPQDYHRVHMPLTGKLLKTLYIPGRLFSVSPLTVRVIPRLFARNERAICLFSTALGSMAVVLVGAVGVASIQLIWQGLLKPEKRGPMRVWDYPNQEIQLSKGAELGNFNMGSTVILLFPPGDLIWEKNLASGAPIKMGKKLAEF